jgi:hypothetical protein
MAKPQQRPQLSAKAIFERRNFAFCDLPFGLFFSALPFDFCTLPFDLLF